MNTCHNAPRAPRAPRAPHTARTALAHGALGASNGSHRRRHLATMAVALGLSLSPLAARAQHGAAELPVPTAAPTTTAAHTPPTAPGRPPLAPSVDVAALAARAAEQARMDVDTSFASMLMKRERVVKGAPYCAQAVHETVQPLMDGNRIVHKQNSQLCRDGEGRTRQEVDRQGRRLVYLRDPVSGENWLLDPERKTARFLGGRVEARADDPTDEIARREAERQRDYAQRQKDYAERMRDYAERVREWAQERTTAWRDRGHTGETTTVAEAAAGDSAEGNETKGGPTKTGPRPQPHPEPRPDAQPNARPLARPTPVPPPPPPRAVVIAPAIDRQEVRIIQIGTPDGIDTPTPPIPAAVGLSAERLTAAGGKSQVETLSNRELDGLKVTGRRVTNTIEAGKVGNEKPIVITTEVWTSPDLQLTVSSVQKDPRSGEQNYLLKDIRRSEPDATLMKVPADYRRIGVPAAKKG